MPMRRIIYVHYQIGGRDGAFVHAREFSRAFRMLCRERDVVYHVVGPPFKTARSRYAASSAPLADSLKRSLGPFYLHDISTFLKQRTRGWREREMLRRLRPDLVITRYEEHTVSILWACRSRGIPVVLEINSPEREQEHWRGHYRRVPSIKRLFGYQYALSLAGGAYAVSTELGRELRMISRPGQPIAVIPNGVTVERFNPDLSGDLVRRRYGIATDAVVVGYIGNFARWHHLDALIDRLPELSEALPTLHLLLVGQLSDNEQPFRERLQTSPHGSRVTLTGFVTSEDIPAHLAAMDMTVLPATASYCSPLKILEYMAMAKAIVAPATPPVIDTIRHGHEGLLFPPGDYAAMAEAIVALGRDRARRIDLGSNARRRVCADCTWHSQVERVYELGKEVYDRAHLLHHANEQTTRTSDYCRS